MEHQLQKAWADEAVENAYFQRIEAMVQAGDLDAASAILEDDLASLDTPLGQLCRDLSEEAVDIAGWEELGDSISQYEGEPITAVHIMISNEPDLVFEDKSVTHHPMIEVVFYSDEHLAFSEMSREELLAASLTEDESWWGLGEDMEAYLEINGLSQLNTALLHHKRQYYFRDQMHVLDEKNGLAADTAPLLYVEFRLTSMLRSVRYHQAVKALVEGFGLRKNVPVLVGMHNMKPEISSVYMAKSAVIVEMARIPKLAVTIKRNMEEIPEEFSGSSLRQRVLVEAEEERPGFFRRLFGRR
ncbi:hypothetical protein [Sphingorhabdus sp.]|uniref:hypothetical protein n=1 Tax=Sphingorhabdus sp. TaxID=1902408 RepID=UPI0032B6FB74